MTAIPVWRVIGVAPSGVDGTRTCGRLRTGQFDAMGGFLARNGSLASTQTQDAELVRVGGFERPPNMTRETLQALIRHQSPLTTARYINYPEQVNPALQALHPRWSAAAGGGR